MNKSCLRVMSCLAVLLGSAVAPGAEVRVVASQPEQVRLVWQADADQLASGEAQTCWVGLPQTGEPSLEVIGVHPAGELAVAPQGEVWCTARGPARLSAVGYVRDQRVVGVTFGPQQLGKDRVSRYDQVEVVVHFGGSGVSSPVRPDRWGEELYQSLLVNYEQARGWRHRNRGAAKPAQAPEGQTFRVVVRESGMYRITGQDLAAAGVELAGLDPAQIALQYGGGRALPVLRPAELDLAEVATVVEDGGDGRFDPEDYLLFYGEGLERWEYQRDTGRYLYRRNLYTRDNVYFLVLGAATGKRAQRRSGALADSAPQRPASYRARLHEESEERILIQHKDINSGYEWYWQEFTGNARNFPLTVQGAAEGPVQIRLAFFGNTDAEHPFVVKWNDAEVGRVSFKGSKPDTLRLEAAQGVKEGQNALGLVHLNKQGTRFDWYELEYSRAFLAQRGELNFEYPVSGGVSEFALSGFGEGRPRLFDVSANLAEIDDFAYDQATGRVQFQDGPNEIPHHYLAVLPSRWKRPFRIESAAPAGLKAAGQGAEYVLISHGDFMDAAQRLGQWRARDDRFGRPFSVKVVDVQAIYDEFSGGLVDPAAIRNFLRYAYEHWDPIPAFVTLVGDGVYDLKNNWGTGPGSWIPPYEDGNSTYDEWYVRVAGEEPDVYPDIAIGRLPVQTAAQAEGVVDKLINYDRNPQVGPWQTRVLLVSDDTHHPQTPNVPEDYFLKSAEQVAANNLPEDLDLVKLYIGKYPLEGRTKPRARDEFIRRFNEGALVLTYIGHGNPEVLAHEQIFLVSRDLAAINNGRRQPLMYTAASQVGVFDDPARESMPEILLNMPEGGVIGMISATRVGYQLTNLGLARTFFTRMFRSGRDHVPLGLALMEAKQLVVADNTETGRQNVQRYSLFGDAATRLAQPRYQIELQAPDTLRALQEVHLSGQLRDPAGDAAGDFNGQVWVQAFDSAVPSELEGLSYIQQGAPIFRGIFKVALGRFEATFRVPKDISYQANKGRISAYAWSADKPAAFGAVGSLVMAGTAAGVAPDEEGPQISLAFQGRPGFKSGDLVPPRLVIEAELNDPSGINVTGETGHEIELRLDEQVLKLTDFFSNQQGDYRNGSLSYELPLLEPGDHTIRLKAWDTFNNSAHAEVQVSVEEGAQFALSEVLFHPNPMQESGYFTYFLAETASRVDIRVYSLAGRLIDQITGTARLGYNQVAWTPPVQLANGSYLYQLEVSRPEGSPVQQSAVLQVMK
ncbi:MAG: type IX secretion system sortase PorU [Candidatus Latescibacteria bacterium]|nr:type IX secretion system sortase PorU [Candidatus Latescibacterota bacterium]